MRKLNKILPIFFLITVLLGNCLWAGQQPDKRLLVTLNGEELTADDFRSWWGYWREDTTPFAGSLDAFIEWHLLVQEAKRMELNRAPSFQKKILTFLTVRSLMALKNEEVDAKVVVTEEDIKSRFKEYYTPVWEIEALYISDPAKARTVYEKLVAKTASFEDFREKTAGEEDSYNYHEMKLSPSAFVNDPELQVLRGMKAGDMSEPLAFHGFHVILRVKAMSEAAADELDLFKEDIRRSLIKNQFAILTGQLTQRLLKKFEVTYDEELLSSDFSTLQFSEETLDKPVAMTNHGDIPFRTLVNEISQDRALRRNPLATESGNDNLPRNYLMSIVAQQISMWEALERHYETKSPIKPVYDFYVQHRLIKEFEVREAIEAPAITEEETVSYYQKNADEFTSPEQVKIVVFEGDPETLKKLWVDVVRGEDFFEAAKKYPENRLETRRTLLSHLNPVVQAVIGKLDKGEVSSPFTVDDKHVMLHLVERRASETIPLDRVRSEISGRLKMEKAAAIRAESVAKLKKMSDVKVDNSVWQDLQKELGE